MANGKGFRRTFKGLFVRDEGVASEGDPGAADLPESDAPATELEVLPIPTGAPRPRPATPAGGDGGMLTANFPDIYVKTNTLGDPHTDPLLAAYVEAAAEGDERMRAVAMRATIRALGANPESVESTLKGRVGVLKAAVAQQNEAAEGRRKARADALTQKETETTARIAELTTQIQGLRDALARETTANQAGDTSDRNALTGFQQRVSAEITRLDTLDKFLDTVKSKKGKE